MDLHACGALTLFEVLGWEHGLSIFGLYIVILTVAESAAVCLFADFVLYVLTYYTLSTCMTN